MTTDLGWPAHHQSLYARWAHLAIATRLLGDILSRPWRLLAATVARR